MITTEQKAEFDLYVEKLDKAIINNLATFSRSLLHKMSSLKLLNKEILKEILINFDRLPDNIDNMVAFLSYQKAQEEEFKKKEEYKDTYQDLLYIKNSRDFLEHPLIIRALSYYMFVFSEQVCLTRCLFPKQALENKEFKFPVLYYNPPSYNQKRYVRDSDPIPTASSNIRFESFYTAERSIGASLPKAMMVSMNKGYIEFKDLAFMIADLGRDLARCIDGHMMEENVLSTMKFMSDPIGYIGHNTQLIHNNEVRLLVPNDKYKVDNKNYSHTSWTTHDFNVVNNFVAYRAERPGESKVERRNNILKCILDSAAKMDSAPRYRQPDILFINRTFNDDFKIQKAQHDDVEFHVKESLGLYNYIGSFSGIHIIETDLIAKDIMLLTQRDSVGYGISKLPNLKDLRFDASGNNNTFVAKVEDVVCFPTAKTPKYREGSVRDEQQEYITINHPGLIIHLID